MPRTPRAWRPMRAHVVLVEAHRLAAVAEQHHVVLAVGERGADQEVAFVQVTAMMPALRGLLNSSSGVFFTVPSAVAMKT